MVKLVGFQGLVGGLWLFYDGGWLGLWSAVSRDCGGGVKR